MKKLIAVLVTFLVGISHAQAAVWIKLHEKKTEKLMLDKQSILEKDNLKRAWVKVDYKTPQKNSETPDKEYNQAKLLWFFDCPSQKAATSQVIQYLNNELVYSAGIDVKGAEFIEPVPETDLDVAMRYVCKVDKLVADSTTPKPVAEKATVNPEKEKIADKKVEPAQAPAVEKKEEAKKEPEQKKTETKKEAKSKEQDSAEKEATKPAKDETKSEDKHVDNKSTETKTKDSKGSAHKTHWTYEGKEGPENWGKLSPEFITCDTGRNQSPINIEETMHASIKSLKSIQKFPAKDIVNNGHTVQINFKEGNMLVLDNGAYQMKQVHFHAPSENIIRGKSYPLEAHFVHADSKGNLTVIGVMFTEGKENPGLAKLWEQLPTEAGDPVVLKNLVKPSEMIPENRSYYRFSGSLTTPPCSEGVRWLLMKNPMTASKEQIEAFKHAVHHENNRPVQPLNGRVVVE